LSSINSDTLSCGIKVGKEEVAINRNVKNPPAERALLSVVLEIEGNVVVGAWKGHRGPIYLKSLPSTGGNPSVECFNWREVPKV